MILKHWKKICPKKTSGSESDLKPAVFLETFYQPQISPQPWPLKDFVTVHEAWREPWPTPGPLENPRGMKIFERPNCQRKATVAGAKWLYFSLARGLIIVQICWLRVANSEKTQIATQMGPPENKLWRLLVGETLRIYPNFECTSKSEIITSSQICCWVSIGLQLKLKGKSKKCLYICFPDVIKLSGVMQRSPNNPWCFEKSISLGDYCLPNLVGLFCSY